MGISAFHTSSQSCTSRDRWNPLSNFNMLLDKAHQLKIAMLSISKIGVIWVYF